MLLAWSSWSAFLSGLFLLWALSAALASRLDSLRRLSLHGKTRCFPNLAKDGPSPQCPASPRCLSGHPESEPSARDSFSISKRRFLDFYCVGICACAGFAFLVRLGPSEEGGFVPDCAAERRLAFGLFALHLLRRVLEQLFVAESDERSRMHLTAYCLGCL